MTNEEIFDQWCPTSSRWSTWAKPVLFAQALPLEQQSSLRSEWQNQNVSWAPAEGVDTAIVIDLPGTASLLLSLALAKIGYQPVPLFNCCAALGHEVLPTDKIREYLVHGAFDLQSLPLLPTVPPAFILDSDRMVGKNIPHPGEFDNRWMTFPQDFPSGNYLKESGISKVILVQTNLRQPALDLAQVLMRWQDTGIQIAVIDATNPAFPQPLTVVPPPKYRWFFQRTLALVGLMRNSAGGFGSVIPEPSSGAG
jgi:hypothetical protein